MLRTYASAAGIMLISLGLAGLVGIRGTDLPANIFHLGVGGMFIYLGFFQRDAEVVRGMVGGLGVLLLLIKGVVIVAPLLWGERPLIAPIEITCLVVGLLSATFLKNGKQRDAANAFRASTMQPRIMPRFLYQN